MNNQVQRELLQLTEEITGEALQTWQAHLQANITSLISSLEASLEALPRARLGRSGKTFTNTIAEILQDRTPRTWNGVEVTLWEVVQMIPIMRWTIGMRRVIMETLIACLKQKGNWDFLNPFAQALGSMGEAAAQEWVLEELMTCLKQEEYYSELRWSAATALGGLGKTAAEYPGALEMLLGWLRQEADIAQDGNLLPFSHCYVVEALGNMGGTAATDAILAELLNLLKQTRGHKLRRLIVVALEKMGKAVARDWILSELFAWMNQKEDWELYRAAADVLGNLGEAAAQDWILNLLLAQLEQREYRLSTWHIVTALKGMGEAAAQEWVLAKMWPLLKHKSPYKVHRKMNYATALGSMGEAASPDWVIAEILFCMKQNKEEVLYGSAIEALGNMGVRATAYPGVLKALRVCLKPRRDTTLAWLAIEAAGSMGAAAAEYPGILEELLMYLRHRKDVDLHLQAAETLRKMQDEGCRFIFEQRAPPHFLYLAMADQLWLGKPAPRKIPIRKAWLRHSWAELTSRFSKTRRV